MRTHGNLVKWDDSRGFGFIAPAGGGDEIFVHISAFKAGGARPRLGELVSFEVRVKPDGRKAAVGVQRAGETSARRASSRTASDRSGFKFAGMLLSLLAVIAAAVYGYQRYAADVDAASELPARAQAAPSISPSGHFVCDGRRYCSQMTSCAEARYFQQHCPDTRMDGNGDGEPCEQQWCGR